MEYIAKSKNVRITPRKVRSVVDGIKKLSLAVAIEKLRYLARGAAVPIQKTLESAIANSKLKTAELKIKNILVDEGIKMKRRDTSHRPGREGIIHKRSSHITVILTNDQKVKSQNLKVKSSS